AVEHLGQFSVGRTASTGSVFGQRQHPYAGVGRILYDSRQEPVQWMRMALGRFFVSAKANGLELENIAILATTGRGVAKISAALNGGAKPIPHKVLFDERKRAKL
ncbi:hypothetical protein LZK50_22660, partial [Pseudomonas aeruginosa]|nr:hypothetical protein [Pseudomonas aeruginosa]